MSVLLDLNKKEYNSYMPTLFSDEKPFQLVIDLNCVTKKKSVKIKN
jgi:hypothetical protein